MVVVVAIIVLAVLRMIIQALNSMEFNVAYYHVPSLGQDKGMHLETSQRLFPSI